MNTSGLPPTGSGSRSRRMSLAVGCLGVVMPFLNTTITIGSLPAIQVDLGISPSTLVWVSSAFLLATASLVLAGGTAGNLYGQRRMFTVGTVLLGAGGAVVLLIPGVGAVIAGQVVIGAGGALTLPTGLAILTVAFPEPRRRTEAISIWAACSGLALAAGPVLAGLLAPFSWHGAYLVHVVLAVAALTLLRFAVASAPRDPNQRLDVAGVLLGTLAVGSLTYAVIQGGASGFTSGPVVLAVALFVVAVVVLPIVESRVRGPMLDMDLFRSGPGFATVMAVAATGMFTFTGVGILMVLYLARVQGLSILESGWRLLLLFGVFTLASGVSPKVLGRLGLKGTLTTGLVLVAAGALLLLVIGPEQGFGQMVPGLVVTAIGIGLLMAPSTAAAVMVVPSAQAQMAGTTVNMFRQVGGVLGSSVLGVVASTGFVSALGERLRAAGVPAIDVATIVEGVGRGGLDASVAGSAQALLRSAVPQAYTDALHLGAVVVGGVALIMVLPVALFLGRPAATPSVATAGTTAEAERR